MIETNRPNYWLAAKEKSYAPYMWVDLGCPVEVLGLKVKNTHNSIGNDFSTKMLKVELMAWHTWITSEIHKETLPKSLDEVNEDLRKI